MKKYYDDFVRLPLSKMAQKISEMTYAYQNTDVPKKHYQTILNEELVSLLAQDSTMELVLLNAVVGQLDSLKKESPKLFFKALLVMEKGIKVSDINQRTYDSLETTFDEQGTNKQLLNTEIIESYDNAFENHAITEQTEYEWDLS